jgi:hypothetical protein
MRSCPEKLKVSLNIALKSIPIVKCRFLSKLRDPFLTFLNVPKLENYS